MTWELLCFLLLMKQTPLFVRRLLLWHTMYYVGSVCCCVKTWSEWCKYWLCTFTVNKQHSVAYFQGTHTFNILQAGVWAVVDVLSVSYVCRDLGVHLKMETETGNVHFLNIATDTQHHLVYSVCVRGSSLNSGYSFHCSLSHLVGSCSEQWKVFLNTAAKEICNCQITLQRSTSYWILQRIHHTTSFIHGSSKNRGSCSEQ